MAEKERPNPSYGDGASLEEPTFILRGQDIVAPEIVREWAYRAAMMGAPREKIEEARKIADRMEDWQIAHHRKVPD